jgi:hypothetical protein
LALKRPVVGMGATGSGAGYWLVASDGGIFSFGDARFSGSTGSFALAQPIVGMQATPSGDGYWLAAGDGGVFSFGSARFYGSAAGPRPDPVVALARTPSGKGYWVVGADGAVASYGDAVGPTGEALTLACLDQSVVGAGARAGGGYWLVTSPLPAATWRAGTHPLDQLVAESTQLATLLRRRQACQPGAAPARGRFASPLPGTRISSRFGSRIHPVYLRAQFHDGIDFGGGGSVRAAGDGVVAEVTSRVGYGLAVVIDHGDGTATVYGHLANTRVATAQPVKRGQVIGAAGASGFATGVHLHFEVRIHGDPTDPALWL